MHKCILLRRMDGAEPFIAPGLRRADGSTCPAGLGAKYTNLFLNCSLRTNMSNPSDSCR